MVPESKVTTRLGAGRRGKTKFSIHGKAEDDRPSRG
jgi:hypothetical protein